MEIPTKEIIAELEKIIPKNENGQVTEASVKTQLDAIKLIKDQAREIRDLQTTIVRLKDEYRISSDLRELEKNDVA